MQRVIDAATASTLKFIVENIVRKGKKFCYKRFCLFGNLRGKQRYNFKQLLNRLINLMFYYFFFVVNYLNQLLINEGYFFYNYYFYLRKFNKKVNKN